MSDQLIEFPEKNDLFDAAARIFVESAERAMEERGRFTVALAGGSTPRGLYLRLAKEPFRSQIDWRRVFFFFGDERFVPAGDPESNFRMVRETLFEPLGIDEVNIYNWRTEIGDPKAVAVDYAAILRDFFSGEFPVFDLALLGLGADGHTASLFPGTEALHERSKTAVANFVPLLGVWRLTLTFPVFEAARKTLFLINGESKSATLKAVIEGDPDPDGLPAQRLRGRANVVFLADSDAAN